MVNWRKMISIHLMNPLRMITLILSMLIIVMMMGCSFNSIPVNKTNVVKEYELIDFNGVNHLYKDDVNVMVFPIHNKLLTQYCREHKCWEDIQARWSLDRLSNSGNYRYNYFVMENK